MMHAKLREQWFTLVAMAMIVCLALQGACRQHSQPALPLSSIAEASATPAQLPRFLSYIHPLPEQQVVQGALSGKLGWATLRLEEIAEPDETLGLEEMQARVDFLIDDELLVPEIVQSPKPGSSEIAIIGDFALGLGKHEATVQVRRTSGKVLEYSWTFTILGAEEATMTSLPKGLRFVRPLPDSTITLQAYREEQLVLSYQAPAYADLRGGVCVGVQTIEILEPDEDLDCAGVSRKYSFVMLDGVSVGRQARIEEGCTGEIVNVSENGMTTSGPGSHYKCWKVKLAPGKHEAVVELWKASGEVVAQYTWEFTIMED